MSETSRDTSLVVSPLLADEPEWDEARLQVLVKAIGRGNHFPTACKLAMLPKKTFDKWMREGEKEDAAEELRRFFVLVTMAEATAEDTLLGAVSRGARRDWHAALAVLERRFPTWSPVNKIDLKGNLDMNVAHTLPRSREERASLYDELLAAAMRSSETAPQSAGSSTREEEAARDGSVS
jgi:hypothetical protein